MTTPTLRDKLAQFRWSHEPAAWHLAQTLDITTRPDTDYWQRTHYGFRRDNGHFFFVPLLGDFTLTAQVAFEATAQYDQCGVMCRAGAESWIKASVEYEPHEPCRLGSVVTNLGYSDWATQDVDPGLKEVRYRLSRRDADFRVEAAIGDGAWQQLRIAHLHGCPQEIEVGVYACSPVGHGFQCKVLDLTLGPNTWEST